MPSSLNIIGSLANKSKLRQLIIGTVSEAKRSQLRHDGSVREWIKSLQASTKPTDTQIQGIVRARHRVMMGAKYMEWPTGGPHKWITEWQKLMSDCERWCAPLYRRYGQAILILSGERSLEPSGSVTESLKLSTRTIKRRPTRTIKRIVISLGLRWSLKQAWDRKTIRNGMRVAGRGWITKAAFAVEPRFDGIKASEDLMDEPQAAPSNSRRRPATESRQRYSSKRSKPNHC